MRNVIFLVILLKIIGVSALADTNFSNVAQSMARNVGGVLLTPVMVIGVPIAFGASELVIWSLVGECQKFASEVEAQRIETDLGAQVELVQEVDYFSEYGGARFPVFKDFLDRAASQFLGDNLFDSDVNSSVLAGDSQKYLELARQSKTWQPYELAKACGTEDFRSVAKTANLYSAKLVINQWLSLFVY